MIDCRPLTNPELSPENMGRTGLHWKNIDMMTANKDYDDVFVTLIQRLEEKLRNPMVDEVILEDLRSNYHPHPCTSVEDPMKDISFSI